MNISRQMDSVEQSSNRRSVEDTSLFQAHFDGYNVFGEPEILPRIGDEFQAVIPPLSSMYDLMWVLEDPAHEGKVDSSSEIYGIGLPVPVMWIDSKVDRTRSEKPEDSSIETQLVKSYDFTRIHDDDMTSVSQSSNLLTTVGREVHEQNQTGFCVPLPGSVHSPFSNVKEEAFLLGLYIFEKNLHQVKQFMESEGTGKVLSHYYGKFYGSPKYRRWSELRKMKIRKCIFGHKIFTGMRQHELLSRLSPNLSTESQNTLLEVSKAFGEEIKSLEDYVFSLKEIVGLDNLVKAIGIGDGKRDLTGLASEQIKYNHASLEIPVGKACSRLSTREVVGFLTGGVRLSKARSNDLFWEAVWPRLLAKGWHSEQPENGYRHRHALVFLVPGVNKFSRRCLVKGNHYFDSVSDVLSKVAMEPGLLDLEVIEVRKEEDGRVNGLESDEESVGEERHRYLKPQTVSDHAIAGMKFTVVDTSRANRDVQKLKELRGLPSEMPTTISLRAPLEEDGNAHSGEPMNLSGSADLFTFSMDEVEIGKQMSYWKKDFECVASSWKSAATGVDSTDVSTELHGEPKEISRDTRARKVVKSRPRPRVRPKMKCMFDRTERSQQKPSSCNQSDTSCNFVGRPVRSIHKQEAGSCCSRDPPASKNNETKGDTLISLEGGAAVSSEMPLKVSSLDHPTAWTLIDLNLPVLPAAELGDGAVVMNFLGDDTLCRDSSRDSSEKQHPRMNPRRKGTRNRPPTARALEALALGLFDTERKRKARDDGCSMEILPTPSRCSSGGALADENHINSGFASQKTKI